MDEDVRPLRGRHHRLLVGLDGVLLSSEGSNEGIVDVPGVMNGPPPVQLETLIVQIHFCFILACSKSALITFKIQQN